MIGLDWGTRKRRMRKVLFPRKKSVKKNISATHKLSRNQSTRDKIRKVIMEGMHHREDPYSNITNGNFSR